MAPEGADVIHVACQADAKFAPDLAVMLESLVTANPDERFEVHFLHQGALAGGLLDGWREIVERTGSRWSPLLVPPDALAGFPQVPHYGGHACWYRLFLHRLLPALPRILYLDADTMIVGRLRELWQTDLRGHALGAIDNSLFSAMEQRVRTTLGVPDARHYFNSGVLLLDLERLRASGLGEQVIELVRAGQVLLPWPDQDALNAVLWPHRLRLHPRWNAMNALWELPGHYLAWSAQEIAEATRDPAIVHFVGPYKPLHYRNRHPLRARYLAHLAQTRWRHLRIHGRSPWHMLLRPLPTRWQWKIESGELEPRAVLRALLPPSSAAGALLRDIKAALRPPGTAPLARVLAAFADHRRDVFFVQVGSNDAQHGDPLRPFVLGRGWRGVMVEPVPRIFARLRRNYGHTPGLILENAAIAAHDGTAEFFTVAESDEPQPEWYDQIGSFSREHLLKHEGAVPRLRERIVALEVPTLSFESLCRKHGVGAPDLVHIDTEGHDFEVIKLIDFARRAPAVLLYEHRHLSEADRGACRKLLAGHGYALLEIGHDTLALVAALMARPWSRLGRAWRLARREGGP